MVDPRVPMKTASAQVKVHIWQERQERLQGYSIPYGPLLYSTVLRTRTSALNLPSIRLALASLQPSRGCCLF